MRRLYLVIFIEFMLIIGVLVMPRTSAQMSGSFPYCNGNYVIPGGITGSSDMSQLYKNPRVAGVYNHFGITAADMNNFNSEAVNGTVTRGGDVIVNGKTVATNAITAGCNNMAGSTAVNNGYMTFYTRPPSVSFASSSLPAYVVMRNGQFDYAIIADCGNPVMATPVTPATTPPAASTPASPAPAKPTTVTRVVTVTPGQNQAQNQTQSQTQTQSQNVNVLPSTTTTTTPAATTTQPTNTIIYTTPNTTAPAAPAAVTYTAPATTTTTTPAYTAPAATKTLPNTGPGSVFALGTIATLFGSTAHWLYSRRLLR